MSDDKISIEELAAQIAQQIRPTVPIEHALWDAGDIACYLRRSPAVVRERIACLPGFPKPYKLPAKREGRITQGHPVWQAIEVINWVKSHRDQVVGRPRKAG